jgi:(2Fe-2S) ferredoxin
MTTPKEVWVCQNRECLANGAAAVLQAFQALPSSGTAYTAIGTECQGMCNMGVTVRVIDDETWYCRIQPAQVDVIVQQHLIAGSPVQELRHPRMHPRF